MNKAIVGVTIAAATLIAGLIATKYAERKLAAQQKRIDAASAAMSAAGLKGAWSIDHADDVCVVYANGERKMKGIYIDADQFKLFTNNCQLLDSCVV